MTRSGFSGTLPKRYAPGQIHHVELGRAPSSTMKNLHMLCSRVRVDGVVVWVCNYCEQVVEEPVSDGCSHVYEPCQFCEGSPESNECAADCSGIRSLLRGGFVEVS